MSNHGGRILDGTPATVRALEAVADAVRGTGTEVYLDGGVRTGASVFKARVAEMNNPMLQWNMSDYPVYRAKIEVSANSSLN